MWRHADEHIGIGKKHKDFRFSFMSSRKHPPEKKTYRIEVARLCYQSSQNWHNVLMKGIVTKQSLINSSRHR